MLPSAFGVGGGDRRMPHQPPPPLSERLHSHHQQHYQHQQQHQSQSQQHQQQQRWVAPPHTAYSYERTVERTSPPAALPTGAPLPPLRASLYRGEPADREREWRQAPPEYASAPGPPPAPARAPAPSSVAVPLPAQRPRFDMFAPFASFAPTSRSVHSVPRVEHLDDDGGEDERDYFHSDMSTNRFRPQSQQGPSSSDYYSDDMPSSASAAAKKRSRRMSNSERGKLYRSRRKEYVEALEEEVETLKRQMEAMRLNRGSAPQRPDPRSSSPPGLPSPYDSALLVQDRSRAGFARIVCEYFSLFQFGVPVSQQPSPHEQGDSPQGGTLTTTLSKDALTQTSRQMGFLQSLMSPNFRFGDNFGVQMLLRQWEHYSTYHAALLFELDALDVHTHESSPFIGAAATLKVRFSRKTIEKVFPHVLWNEPLVQKLIGLEVEYPVMNKFYFSPDGKIQRFETEVDFVAAFIKALGNTREAMQLVGDALIKEQHLIGLEEEAAAAGGGGGGSRSPNGSQGSPNSQSPTDSSGSTAPRYRFKQSEARTTEEVVDDQYQHSKAASGRRFPPESYGQYNHYAGRDERRHADNTNAPYERPLSGRSNSSNSSTGSQWTPPGYP